MKRLLLASIFVVLVFAGGYLYLRSVAALTGRLSSDSVRGIRVELYPKIEEDAWNLIGETEHLRYYVWDRDTIPRWAMELHETECISLCEVLHIRLSYKIDYYKYPSQQALRERTGSTSTGVVRRTATGQAIHTVRRYDPHEVTHAVSHHLGEPPAIFDEGLATLYGWKLDTVHTDAHDRAMALLEQGRLPALRLILVDGDFRRYKSYPAYAAAGSFVGHLMNRYGPEGIRSLFALDRFSQSDEIAVAFERIYGESIDVFEEAWRAALTRGELLTEARGRDTRFEFTAIGVIAFVGVLLVGAMLIAGGEKAFDAVTACFLRLTRRAKQPPP